VDSAASLWVWSPEVSEIILSANTKMERRGNTLSHWTMAGSAILWATMCCPSLAAPPVIPKAFTRAVVERLIEQIEVGANAQVLRVPYFVVRRRHPLPKAEGLKMLQRAAESAPGGSQRWFLLKCTYAFADSRVTHGLTGRGVSAYGEIFSAYPAPSVPAANKTVRTALRDFLRDYGAAVWPAATRAPEGLAAFEAAAALCLRHHEFDDVCSRLGHAAKEAATTDAGRRVIDRLVTAALTGERGESYTTLTRCAEIHRLWKPPEALALLERAERHLPREEADEALWLYETMSDLLVAAGRTKDAIAAHQKLMNLTGRGRARLLALREQAGEKGALESGFAALDYAAMGEPEVKSSFDVLTAEKRPDLARTLLWGYLQAERTRDPEWELWARLRLAGLLAHNGQIEEARGVARTDHLSPPFPTTMAKMHYKRLQMLRRQLSPSNSTKTQE